MTILIVEDESNMQEIWKYFLRDVPADKVCVKTLQAAREQMGKIPPPELVLLDLRLLDADEDKTLKAIKEFNQMSPSSVILVLTGNTDTRLKQVAEIMGADHFIQKIDVENQLGLYKSIMKAISCPNKNREQPPFEASIQMLEMLTDLCVQHASKQSQ